MFFVCGSVCVELCVCGSVCVGGEVLVFVLALFLLFGNSNRQKTNQFNRDCGILNIE